VRWTVLIPTKALPGAKTRLAAATDGPDAHRRLVAAIRRDTVAAARDAAGVARVVLVTDRGVPDETTFVQSAPGLNAGLEEAAAMAARRWPEDGVVALVGDLPALTPTELADALGAAASQPRSFVADHPGTGTTLLAARAGTPLRPAFGPGSAARHAAVAVALAAGPGLRHDVDTADDLRAAAVVGLGDATAAEFGDAAAAEFGDATAAEFGDATAAEFRDATTGRRSPCPGIMGR
jgi:2-phospho-L-lactate guanylyltransferase